MHPEQERLLNELKGHIEKKLSIEQTIKGLRAHVETNKNPNEVRNAKAGIKSKEAALKKEEAAAGEAYSKLTGEWGMSPEQVSDWVSSKSEGGSPSNASSADSSGSSYEGGFPQNPDDFFSVFNSFFGFRNRQNSQRAHGAGVGGPPPPPPRDEPPPPPPPPPPPREPQRVRVSSRVGDTYSIGSIPPGSWQHILAKGVAVQSGCVVVKHDGRPCFFGTEANIELAAKLFPKCADRVELYVVNTLEESEVSKLLSMAFTALRLAMDPHTLQGLINGVNRELKPKIQTIFGVGIAHGYTMGIQMSHKSEESQQLEEMSKEAEREWARRNQ
jgi:hypothetical protein